MNSMEIVGWVAGGLQFVVAGYALRLNRLFGTARVGWSLFCAFSLLALLNLIQTTIPSGASARPEVTIEVIYSLISLLLLTGMVHLEIVLKERLQMLRKEQRMHAELELEVKKKTAYLMRAIEELQAEMDERKRMEVEVETSNTELFFASRKVAAAELATSVLHNMGNLLKSVNVTASILSDQVKQSKIANVVHAGVLIREHAADLGDFMARDPRGQKLPQYIAELANHLAEEQTLLSGELETLKKIIEEIMAMQQGCIKSTRQVDPLGGFGPVEKQPVPLEPKSPAPEFAGSV